MSISIYKIVSFFAIMEPKILIRTISTLKHILQQQMKLRVKAAAPGCGVLAFCYTSCMQFVLSFWNCINYVLRSFSFTCLSHLLAVTDNSSFTACLKLAMCFVFSSETAFSLHVTNLPAELYDKKEEKLVEFSVAV